MIERKVRVEGGKRVEEGEEAARDVEGFTECRREERVEDMVDRRLEATGRGKSVCGRVRSAERAEDAVGRSEGEENEELAAKCSKADAQHSSRSCRAARVYSASAHNSGSRGMASPEMGRGEAATASAFPSEIASSTVSSPGDEWPLAAVVTE